VTADRISAAEVLLRQVVFRIVISDFQWVERWSSETLRRGAEILAGVKEWGWVAIAKRSPNFVSIDHTFQAVLLCRHLA